MLLFHLAGREVHGAYLDMRTRSLSRTRACRDSEFRLWGARGGNEPAAYRRTTLQLKSELLKSALSVDGLRGTVSPSPACVRVCVEEKRQIGHVAHRDCRRQRRRGKDGVTRVPSTEEKWVIGHEAWDGSFSSWLGVHVSAVPCS